MGYKFILLPCDMCAPAHEMTMWVKGYDIRIRENEG